MSDRPSIGRTSAYPPITDAVSKETCFEVACAVAGPNPPTWFITYLEERMVVLAARRVVDARKTKQEYKKKLMDFTKAVNLIQACLRDRETLMLLGEKKYRLDDHYMQTNIDDIVRDKLIKNASTFDHIGGKSVHQEKNDVLRILQDLESSATFTLALPELSGPGRGRVYLRSDVSPKQFCAVIIIVARRHFQKTVKGGKNAFDLAQKFWGGSQTALPPEFSIPPELPQYADDPLGHWRPYFEPRRRREHLPVFEDQNLSLAIAKEHGEGRHPPANDLVKKSPV